jgi:uncharacterized protein (DUF983 family)
MPTDDPLPPAAATWPRRFARALALRCPECGAGGTLAHWLRLRPACAGCGLAFDRGEHDYFLGALAVNLLLTLTAWVATFLACVLATRPRVDWTLALYVSVTAMVVTPVALYPFARLLWLAGDLGFRPRAGS